MKPLNHLDLRCIKLVFRDADSFVCLHGETSYFPSDLFHLSQQLLSCQGALFFFVPSLSSFSKLSLHLFMFLLLGYFNNIKHDFCSRLPGFFPNLLSVSFPNNWVPSVQLLMDLGPHPK